MTIASEPRATDGAAIGDARHRLIGLDRAEFAALVAGIGEKPFRANQLWHWVYGRGAARFEDMTTLAKSLRAALADVATLERPAAQEDRLSADTTRKWLFRFPDGELVETVYIPTEERGTLCMSSQVGCTLTCAFCHTGTQRLVRNLDPGEIVGQIMAARDHLGEWGLPSADRLVTNIVMMGMGEPLYNFDNVKKALRIIMDPEGISLSKRRITLSTSGVVPMMARCGEELGVNLAVSLHAVSDEVRDVLVPLEPQVSDQGPARGMPRLSRRAQRAAHHFRVRHAQGRQRLGGRRA